MDPNCFQNEKLSIKNLLFTKAIPNYTLPVPTDGYSIFACTDCGDKFITKSSFEYHITRKSSKITYNCRLCNVSKLFFNRCGLLCHIRSHAFKTATISTTDLKIEPLPLSFYKYKSQIDCGSEALSPPALSHSKNQVNTDIQNDKQIIACFDCKKNMFCSGIIDKDRAKHYTRYKKNIVYSCLICLLTLTTKCALEAHLRIHMKEPPFYCPDCGLLLQKKATLYPYTHYCESFKMMRAAAKSKCSVNNCKKIFHPSETINHLRTHHLKSVFKCPTCAVACYKLDNMEKHWETYHTGLLKHIDFLQCELCPGRLVIPNQIEKHLKSHENSIQCVYPCWTCGATFKRAKSLLQHQEFKHPHIYIEKMYGTVTEETHEDDTTDPETRARKSGKLCKCFKKKPGVWRYKMICKCKPVPTPNIVCNLCKAKIKQDWNVIKKHFAIHHKEHLCLDVKILLEKVCVKEMLKKINRRPKKHKEGNNKEVVTFNDKNYVAPGNNKNSDVLSDNNKFICNKCGQSYEDKQSLEKHMVVHRDPFMAYQCMECGESFIAKPSFSTHLLLKHGINDASEYIEQKKCYSKESLYLQKPNNTDQNEPLKENQCNICREQFCNTADFEKHFRVHGMAFLMKNTNKSISPENV